MALNRVKWSGIGQSKITKRSFLADSGKNEINITKPYDFV